MLSLSEVIKDLLAKVKVINTNIQDTFIRNIITNEIHRSITSQTDGVIYTEIKNKTMTNLPPKFGLHKETTLNIQKLGGRKVRILSQSIYLGGYGSTLEQQDIEIPANAERYLYLSRNQKDYTKIDIELYDKLLGGDDGDIHFGRIYCYRFKTDANSIVEDEAYETKNYAIYR